MPLPRVNDTQKFTTKLPSTGQIVYYRPYYVQEQRTLMQAAEFVKDKQDPKEATAHIMTAMLDLVGACILNPEEIQVKNFTSFDMEFIFTELRKVSVGEKVDVFFKCDNVVAGATCGADVKDQIDLNTVKLEISPDITNNKTGTIEQIIPVTSKISVKMKFPSLTETLKHNSVPNTTDSDLLFNVLASCIEAVYEENTEYAEFTHADALSFIDQLSQEQFMKLSQFVEKAPQLKLDMTTKCPKCGHEHQREFEGIMDFFI